MRYIESLRKRPLAIETDKANEQHYEVGTGVLEACLGPRMKYSCCLYPKGGETLGQAEIEMLKLYVERAGLEDGMTVLDLGFVLSHLRLQSSASIYEARYCVSACSKRWMLTTTSFLAVAGVQHPSMPPNYSHRLT